jgi:galactose mutarotase-like enzyme
MCGMFRVREGIDDDLGHETVTLEDDAEPSRVVIAPTRGGIALSFQVNGVEAFYLDRATVRDPAKNVRGGNPVLFPSPGKLVNDRFSRGAKSGALGQHGFARNLPFEGRVRSESDRAEITLGLSSSDETRARYPFDFGLDLTYSLRGRTLRVEQRIQNRGADAMPFGFGFHPYFLVTGPEKAGFSLITRATRAFDNVSKREIPFAGLDLTAPEVDLHLADHGGSSASFSWGTGRSMTIVGSPEYTHWVVWTVAGKDYVCIEPWTAPGDALNTGERLIELPPGAISTLWIEMTFEP